MTEAAAIENKVWRVKYISVVSKGTIQWGETPFENEAQRWLTRVRDLYAGQESWAEEITQTEAVRRLDW